MPACPRYFDNFLLLYVGAPGPKIPTSSTLLENLNPPPRNSCLIAVNLDNPAIRINTDQTAYSPNNYRSRLVCSATLWVLSMSRAVPFYTITRAVQFHTDLWGFFRKWRTQLQNVSAKVDFPSGLEVRATERQLNRRWRDSRFLR